MANTKISDLTAATSVAGTDITPIVQSATTKKATFSIIRDYINGTLSQVSGSNATTTNATATDITGLSFAATTSSLYEVDAFLKVQCSSTGGNKYAVAFSAAGATGHFLIHSATAVATGALQTNVLGTLETLALITTANTDYCVFIKAVVSTGANAGNITIQHARVTAGQTATCYIGSRMVVTKLV
jgi:hypothetical protein